jgi:hypothetical protein
LVDDRVTGPGVARVELELCDERGVATVILGDGAMRAVSLERVGARIEVRLRLDESVCDVSAQPGIGIRSLFLSACLPEVSDYLVAAFAGCTRAWFGELDANDEVQLLLAAHPALVALRNRSGFVLEAAIPQSASRSLRAGSFAAAVEDLLPGRRTGRGLLGAVARSMIGAGKLRLREVSIAAAGQRLTDQALEIVLLSRTPDASTSVVEPDTAAAAGRVLSRMSIASHRTVLAEVARDRFGLRALRTIAAAESRGLDISGVKGERQLRWLLDRCAEALAEPAMDSPLGSLNGRVLSPDGMRLRVVTSRQEFAHLGRAMSNCLATWGPASVARGCAIVAVVDGVGTPMQAIEVENGQVVQWEGPSRKVVPGSSRELVKDALREAGVRCAPEDHE